MNNTSFSFLPRAKRTSKPRKCGITEIRGPYYSSYGKRHLSDVLETMGEWIDGFKYAGGSFSLMPPSIVKEMNGIAHEHNVYISTGGWIEYVMRFGYDAVSRYLDETKELGFDIIEISAGFISLPIENMVKLVRLVDNAGLIAKPELGIQFGAGGSTSTTELELEGTKDVNQLVIYGKELLNAGANILMIESEGITENVNAWRTSAPSTIASQLGLNHVMFEAADPAVFEWYVKMYGNEVNLFIDHSQIVQLEALRQGIWGTKSTWGRISNIFPSE